MSDFSAIDALLADAWEQEQKNHRAPFGQVRLTLRYASGVTSTEVASEIASGRNPTEGIHHYTLHPAWDVTNGSIDIIGTPLGAARVVNHLRDRRLVTGEVGAS